MPTLGCSCDRNCDSNIDHTRYTGLEPRLGPSISGTVWDVPPQAEMLKPRLRPKSSSHLYTLKPHIHTPTSKCWCPAWTEDSNRGCGPASQAPSGTCRRKRRCEGRGFGSSPRGKRNCHEIRARDAHWWPMAPRTLTLTWTPGEEHLGNELATKFGPDTFVGCGWHKPVPQIRAPKSQGPSSPQPRALNSQWP